MDKPPGEPAKKGEPHPEVDPLAPVELDEDHVADPAGPEHNLDAYPDDPAVEWGPEYADDDGDPELDDDAGLESDYDEADFVPDYDDGNAGPGSGHGPQPRLAPAPKHGPGHQHGPHEHGPGAKKLPGKKAPGKKAPGKKAPEKKAPGKKAPGKKAPGPNKHPGHRPPHEHGSEHEPGREEPAPNFGHGSGGFGGHFGFGSDPRGRRRGPGTGRRGRPGDVRTAILSLLAEQPMHGYEMIQQIAERSSGLWRPSPGSVYPTLQLLGDEGLIVGSESVGSKKLFELTEDGRSAAEKISAPPWAQFGQRADSDQADIRAALEQLFGAVAQAAYAAAVGQQQRVVGILKSARRQIYTLLAESD